MQQHNPWAGLASYQDPATSGSTLLFCGRDNESYDIATLVDNNIFSTLYGKSGTGKTSLLNAGVFPRLREKGYLPLSIRLGMEAMGKSFQRCVADRLQQVVRVEESEVVALPADEQDEQWLWAWFARSRFVDEVGAVQFPVIVFDQFEEVFRQRRTEAEALLRQISYMAEPSHSLGDNYDYNFRFLASIREDDLYLLEDSLDCNFLSDLKQCRYRLRALDYENALDVVLRPGKGVLKPSEAQTIAETVIDMSLNERDGTISTNLLSMLCSRLYIEKERRRAAYITLEMLGQFMEVSPFVQFYKEATDGFSLRERNFLERNLVDSAGRRNSISESDFRMNIRHANRLLEGDCRILQRSSAGTGSDDYRIELIHDSFCEPLVEIREHRGSTKMVWWMLGGFAFACLVVGLLFGPIFAYLQMPVHRAKAINGTYAVGSLVADAEGNGDLAIRLALEGLRPDSTGDWTKEFPYSHMAHAALIKAMQHHPSFSYLFAVDTIDNLPNDVWPLSDEWYIITDSTLAFLFPGYFIDHADTVVSYEWSMNGIVAEKVFYQKPDTIATHTGSLLAVRYVYAEDSVGNVVRMMRPEEEDLIRLAKEYCIENHIELDAKRYSIGGHTPSSLTINKNDEIEQ